MVSFFLGQKELSRGERAWGGGGGPESDLVFKKKKPRKKQPKNSSSRQLPCVTGRYSRRRLGQKIDAGNVTLGNQKKKIISKTVHFVGGASKKISGLKGL